MNTPSSFIKNFLGILLALSLLQQLFAQEPAGQLICNLQSHPSFYLQNPEHLLDVWCSQPIDIASYSRDELNLQQSLNQKEDLIVTLKPESLVGHDNPVYSDIDQAEITPYTWKWVHLEIFTEGLTRITAKLRRPNWWLEKHDLLMLGDTGYVSLNALGIAGDCVVKGIYPNTFDSRLADDDSVTGLRPVIGFFEQEDQTAYSFLFSGGETIEATPEHPVWSCDRGTWVPISQLSAGENVLCEDGADLQYLSSVPLRGNRSIYNIEVYRDHTYYVGAQGLLAHNTCIGALLKTLGEAAQKAEIAALKKAGVWAKLFDGAGNSRPLHEALKNLKSVPATKELLEDLKKIPELLARLDANPKLVDAWMAVSKHADLRVNPRFLENISGFSDDLLKQLDDDLLNPKWADELRTLFKESPDDVTSVWKKLKDDPSEAWEISKADPAWEKWSQREFFKEVTALGKRFEEVTRTKILDKSSDLYNSLKSYLNSKGLNIDDFKIYDQVQLKYANDDYFVGDIVLVRQEVNAVTGQVRNKAIVLETKLRQSTNLTSPQTNALNKVKGSDPNLVARSSQRPSLNGGSNLNAGTNIDVEDFIKVWGDGTGEAFSGLASLF